MSKYLKFSLVLLMGALLLSGCALSEKIQWLDNEAGKLFNDVKSRENIQLISTSSHEWLDQVKTKVGSLSKEQKDNVDKFLADNNLNRYGDTASTTYASGTPLFNEITGESVDRFEYILKNHPEIWEKIKNSITN